MEELLGELPEKFLKNTSYLLDNYSSATLSQINHVTNQNGRSLDLCFVSVQDVAPFICEAPSPLVKLVNHQPPLLVSLHRKLENYVDTSSAAFFYDFRKADHRSISNLISSLDWGNILDHDDVDRAAETFSHVLSYIVDRHVPKIVKHNPPHAPWQTSGLRRLKSYKRATLRKFSKYRTLSLTRNYAQLNHEYKRTAKSCFSQYQRGLQRKLKTHPKKFWKYVKEQRNESGLPSRMTLNGILASNSQDISRLFAEKFASVFSNERLSEDQIRNAMSSVPISGQAMNMVDINVGIVREAALELKTSYNPGPDGIPSVFLKTYIDGIITPLLHVFQLSITSGIFPSCWFPVHKKGNRQDVANYRSITSLSAVAKLFELVIMEPLLAHCKPYISDDQHGFMPGRSIATNLLYLTSYINSNMVDRSQTDVIYTDLTARSSGLHTIITAPKELNPSSVVF
ncbi:uncharacterized protein LOC134206685 [Armigeres subalbatus]|uniref:uncharacterized protein LOC134206685 n=1 Tax=Armigeres subalbatus TaxID=124917 RepID=UPI002ED30F69